jgi:hypothetical protein
VRNVFDDRKFCPACHHQGARPVEQCQCAPCVYAYAGAVRTAAGSS